jgi:hypothetical protein
MLYCHHGTLHYKILINPTGGENVSRRSTAVDYLESAQISEHRVVRCQKLLYSGRQYDTEWNTFLIWIPPYIPVARKRKKK